MSHADVEALCVARRSDALFEEGCSCSVVDEVTLRLFSRLSLRSASDMDAPDWTVEVGVEDVERGLSLTYALSS